ncbi:hypothetical protein DFP72DRAFT_1068086 [Ephemerocybe angulata]|uniref:Anaphase-promoting complex subunit 2 n=1 Tax=Ephemerocybe angulata TaxID=980116 RepID=A0A8H6HZ16_9AGAR|nr:hypothetical protein DFP72DRAFT_1068086 [Tulosesus angulatus]
MATSALRTQVSVKYAESLEKLLAADKEKRLNPGLLNYSQALTLASEYLRPYDIKDRAAMMRPRTAFNINDVRTAFAMVHFSHQLPALTEIFLEDMRKSFHLIEYEINAYMTRYEETKNLELFRMLVSRLHDWFKAWHPPTECASPDSPSQTHTDVIPPSLSSFFSGTYTLSFQTRLFAALPPSFARGFKALASWCLAPEDYPPMVSASGAPIKIDAVWTEFEKLGLIERYESVISSVAYEHIERRIEETCPNNWAAPMLPEIREWMTQKVVPWMLKIFTHGVTSRHDTQSLLTGIGARFDFHVNKVLCDLRIKEIFNIIVDYPDSLGALQDLKETLQRVDQRGDLVKFLRKENNKRLLHPGADTQTILQQYVSTIKCLRIVDPPGVLLYKVANPIRQYLRERPDTIRCIVGSLVGDDENGDSLVDDDEPIQPLQQPESEDYGDLEWNPEPIDAGPEFKTNKPSDVISTLVSIYDSKDLFVKELQVLLAQRLLAIDDNDTARVDKERRNIEILKIRFGDAALQVCAVMLKDMTDSKRTDDHIQGQTPSVVHPTVISHHFWPTLDQSDIVMPGQFQQLQEDYAKEFSVFKPDKKLKWLPHLGTVHLELELQDRTLDVDVPPLEAAFIELFSRQDTWALEELIKAVGNVDRSSAVKALSTWTNMGVIKEQNENTFVLLEQAEDGAEMWEMAPIQAAPSLPPVQTMQQVEAEQMRVHWKFIEGMLTNLGSLSVDRIQTMLRFSPNYDKTAEQLGYFLEAARREGLLVVQNGMWRLNK